MRQKHTPGHFCEGQVLLRKPQDVGTGGCPEGVFEEVVFLSGLTDEMGFTSKDLGWRNSRKSN